MMQKKGNLERHKNGTSKNKKYRYFLLAPVLLLLWTIWNLTRLLSNGWPTLLNSDNLFPEGFYRDLFINHNPISGWLAVRAPGFFPDLLMFLPLRALTGDFLAATQLYMLFLLAFFTFNFWLLIRYFFDHDRLKIFGGNWLIELSFVLGWCSLLLLPHMLHPQEYAFQPLLFIGVHSSPCFFGILLTWLFFRELENPSKLISLFQLFFISFFASISDLWFAIQFIAPTAAVLLMITLQRKSEWLKHFRFIAALAFGTIFSQFVTYLLEKKKLFFFAHSPIGNPNQTYIDQLQHITEGLFFQLCHYPSYSISLMLVWTLGAISLWKFIRNKPIGEISPFSQNSTAQLKWISLLWLTLFSTSITLTIIFCLKLWVSPEHLRYLLPGLLLPWITLGLYFCALAKKFTFARRGMAVVTLAPLLSLSAVKIYWPPSLPQVDIKDYHECLDKVVLDNHLVYGLSEYTQAKLVSFFSKRTRLNQVGYDLRMVHWINNYHWYQVKDSEGHLQYREYDFFVCGYDQTCNKTIPEIVGPPTKTVECGGAYPGKVWIYQGEAKQRLNEALRPHLDAFFKNID